MCACQSGRRPVLRPVGAGATPASLAGRTFLSDRPYPNPKEPRVAGEVSAQGARRGEAASLRRGGLYVYVSGGGETFSADLSRHPTDPQDWYELTLKRSE